MLFYEYYTVAHCPAFVKSNAHELILRYIVLVVETKKTQYIRMCDITADLKNIIKILWSIKIIFHLILTRLFKRIF